MRYAVDGQQIHQPGAEQLWTQLWLEQARKGVIWVPDFVTNPWAAAIRMALYGSRGEPEVTLFLNSNEGGERQSFDPCYELWWRWNNGHIIEDGVTAGKRRTTTIVQQCAFSIGLSYSVAATRRLAYPEARFMVHGESRRTGKRDDDGLFVEDRYAANWLARFTERTEEEWLEYMGDGVSHEFGVEEALKWGVIDEVLEGV